MITNKDVFGLGFVKLKDTVDPKDHILKDLGELMFLSLYVDFWCCVD